MFRKQCNTVRLDLDDTEDLKEYNDILSDPNCTIVREIKEKLCDKEFEDGKLVSLHERIVLIVTYETKSLL
jgi:hypothetical protein